MPTDEFTKLTYLEAESPNKLVELINDFLMKYPVIKIDYIMNKEMFGAYILYIQQENGPKIGAKLEYSIINFNNWP